MLRRKTTNRFAVLPLLLTLAGVVPFVPAFAGDPPRPPEVLQKAIKSDGRVGYLATVQIVTKGDRGAPGIHVQRTVRGPNNCRRIETLAPASMKGRLIVSDGKTRWEFRPQTRVVREEKVQPLDQSHRTQLEQLDLVNYLVKMHYMGQEAVAGRDCHVIGVQPGGSSRVRKKVWVDTDTYSQLKWERYNSQGSLSTQWMVLDIDYSYTPSGSEFRFVPPRGTTVERPVTVERMPLQQAEQTIGFDAVLPSYVPYGFVLHKSQVGIARLAGQAALWMRYFNGVDDFSLFQSRRLQRPPASFGRALYWEAGAYSFLLVGDISDGEKKKVKDSSQN